ncbi:sugar phosphate isomerase/epimerase [Candidatus Woesearchaeota archaeon]|nr:MAG: sugar phosphate isomerase/epimerase [Candidatus Woesearchaeota archaeon]
MIFNNGYYNALDRGYYGNQEPVNLDAPKPVYEMTSKLGPQELGTTTHPMQNTLQSLVAKIRSGAGKIEFSFIGQGKTNSQQPGPEAFGSRERQDMKDLVTINKIRTSTHASVHGGGLGGLHGGEGAGFRRDVQQNTLKEIEKAIHFAAEATNGGAVVFHTGEWQRPLSELKEKTGEQLFKSYQKEDEDATVYFADNRTGRLVSGVSKDQDLYEPEFETKKVNGEEYYVDVRGNLIPKDAPVERLFDRVPKWDAEHTNFKIRKKKWADFEKDAEEWNRNHADEKPKSPGEMFLLTRLQNQILQAKGNSLYHAQRYEHHKEVRDRALDALKFYENLERDIPEDEKWKIMKQKGFAELIPPKSVMPTEYLKEIIKSEEDSMRHVHEASSAADAQAKEVEESLKYIKPIKDVGLPRTYETIARAAMTAMKYTEKNKDKLDEAIYVAPENFMPQQFGSHPDEIREIIKGSRQEMVKRLMHEGMDKTSAEEKAKTHIKATIDIGHFNLWRSHFEPKDGESIEDRDKRFNTWVIEQTSKLAKEGIIGHVHLTDNFGYDDEHITPGQGNAPIKEFIAEMEKAGLNDFIIEPGSFNGDTSMHETWNMLNSSVYQFERLPGFSGFHEKHFGYHAPPNYIVGAYAPSNEWKLWSEVPLE